MALSSLLASWRAESPADESAALPSVPPPSAFPESASVEISETDPPHPMASPPSTKNRILTIMLA